MKKTILITYFSLLTAFMLFGQTTIEPSTVSQAAEANAIDVVAHSTVTNDSDKNESYRWLRNVIAISEGWTTAVCDKELCYLDSVDEAIFDLDAGESDRLDVHVYPDGTEGQAHVEISLQKESTGEEVAMGVYLFNMDATGTLETIRTNLVVYPNPTTDAFQISTSINDLYRVELYNAIGKRIDSFPYYKGDSYSVADYPRGFYFVKILNRAQETISVKRLQKM